MQKPANLDLVMYQGASWDYQLTWNVSNAPVDLTSYTARMQVRPTYDSTAVALSLTTGSGITLGGTAGTILLEASAVTTAGVAEGQYVYDLELVTASNGVTRLVGGNFIVDPEVTR